jgi:hypothetical protein
MIAAGNRSHFINRNRNRLDQLAGGAHEGITGFQFRFDMVSYSVISNFHQNLAFSS